MNETIEFKQDINKEVLMQFMQKNGNLYSVRDYDMVTLASKAELSYAISATIRQGEVYNYEYLLSDTIEILIDLKKFNWIA